jgi:hypothetical protein
VVESDQKLTGNNEPLAAAAVWIRPQVPFWGLQEYAFAYPATRALKANALG